MEANVTAEKQRWNSKHRSDCSFVLHFYHSSENSIVVTENAFRSLPGASHRVFYVIFTPLPAVTKLPEEVLIEHSKYINNIIFVDIFDPHQINVLKRDLHSSLFYAAARFDVKNSQLVIIDAIFPNQPNFKGRVLTGLVSPVSGTRLEQFQESGVWQDYLVATMYYMCEKVNGTLAVETVFGVPREGVDEDGEWDDYTKPLLVGAATISGIVTPTSLSLQVVFVSKPIYYDRVVFIHRLPKKIKFSSLAVLYYPLNTIVWYFGDLVLRSS
ncbi:unnamed protein product [Allacma fusca]|uniref:Uncharacterized protein n=1 Tax=Allacma fusca TaxID=39272 RepID=A0A8J2JC81_9HEXA|nr:unnamed protein product [Allacma fusca]